MTIGMRHKKVKCKKKMQALLEIDINTILILPNYKEKQQKSS